MASERARNLRKNLTDAERFVWARLRDRRVADFKFRRQAPLGAYIIDFVCFEKKLILELDGGQHAEQQPYDTQRTKWLQTHGFQVMRFWNHEVLTDWETIEEAIWRALQ
jgi:very-short-patch-repair endonuclease